MKNRKIYLDVCAYNRPFDNQAQIKIRLETEAKLFIQENVKNGKYSLCWSFMLDYENNKSPYEEILKAITPWKNIADDFCQSSTSILLLGKDIMRQGIKHNDALHIACAIEKQCDYFITTDKGLTNKNIANIASIKIINPIDFIRETEDLP